LLLNKQKIAQKELAKKLRSAKYLTKISEWEQFLKIQAVIKPTEINAKLSIKQLADRRILKNYKRIVKEGSLITVDSHCESLHDLRKSCKKLRYLMEFFQSLYLEDKIKHFIKNLKGLQEVLGDFQDYAVQEEALKLFSKEMISDQAHTNTLLAMGMLIQNLNGLKEQARKDFSLKFETFKQQENQAAFNALLAGKD
jgi:CHAD domain-containing protein